MFDFNFETIQQGFPTVVDPSPSDVLQLFKAVIGEEPPGKMIFQLCHNETSGQKMIGRAATVRWVTINESLYLTIVNGVGCGRPQE